MPKPIRCSIVTPTGSVFEGDVEYASVPAWDGQLGVMAGQSPVLTRLGAGPLRLEIPGEGTRWYLVAGGFAQVQNDALTLLADHAQTGESVSRDEARAELEEARSRVCTRSPEQPQAVADQQRAYAKLAVADRVAAR